MAKRRGEDLKDGDSKLGIPMTKKKFAELDLSLLHRESLALSASAPTLTISVVQQNVEIPDIVLTIHPAVNAAIAHAHANDQRATVDSLDSALLSDTSFLNKLQGEVNSWIKEIQNVTKLTRDVSSGTASQEINFWLSMEKALEAIEEQLRSEPIGEIFPPRRLTRR